MTEENNKVSAGNPSELPLDFDNRQSFAEPPQAPFRPRQEPQASPENTQTIADEPAVVPDVQAGQPDIVPVASGEETPARETIAQASFARRETKPAKSNVLPGTAPVPPPGTPVRRPAPIIAAGHRNVGIATQCIGTENRGPVVSLAASQLPGAEKNVEILPYGRIFVEARKRSGKTLEEVGNLTLIRADYIKALEAEDMDNLPAVTYVIAYARKLGKLYNMPEEQVNDLVATIRSQLEYVVPEELIVRLGESGNPSEENMRTIRKFMVISGIAIGVLILIVAGIITVASWSYTSSEEENHEVVSDHVAGELIPAPALEIRELRPN